MADQLATPSDLASWLQQDLDTSTATLAIEVATGAVQAATGQRFVSVTNETVTLDGGGVYVWLPERPVTAVGAVTVSSYGVSSSVTVNVDYTVDLRGGRLRWSLAPFPSYSYSYAGYPQPSGAYPSARWPELVTVTYSHGYASGQVPQVIRGVVLAAAARLFTNPQGLVQQTTGGVSESWSLNVASSAILTPAEIGELAQYADLAVA